ncbi:hypothetical protein KRMM14A1004_15930 [Krasilnikovia sp. MM14-A1004]
MVAGLAASAVAALALTAGGSPAIAATASLSVGVPAFGGGLTSLLNPTGGAPQTYYEDGYGAIHQLNQNYGRWSDINVSTPSAAIQARPGSALASLPLSSDRVYYFSGDGHLQELAQAWNWQTSTDVTVASRGLPAVAGSGLAAIAVSGGNPRVYYINAAGHIEEMAWGGGWHQTDVTAGGAVAGAGSKLTAVALGGSSPRVYYTSAAGHIIELSWGGGWHSNDLTARVGGAVAEPGSSLSSVVANGNPAVYYTSGGGHIQELAYSGGWHVNDITARTGSVPAASRASLAAASRPPTGGVRVGYISADGHVRELHNDVGAGWVPADVTNSSAGPVATPQGGLTAIFASNPDGTFLRYYHTTASGDVVELAWNASYWYSTDITAR